MNSLSTQVMLGAGVALLAVVLSASVASLPIVIAFASVSAMAAAMYVAFAAQLADLRDRERLVYRPVYVRNETVQRRVMRRD